MEAHPERLDTLQQTVVDWVQKHIGPVHKVARQGRWRPAWFIEAEEEGEPVSLYVRGGRDARFPPLPLSYEAEVQALFADEGVRVPRIHGYIESIPALVMDQLPGQPDIANAESDEARDRLREQLADEMRKIHEIDPARLAALGVPVSQDPREITLLHYRSIERLYLTGDRLPSPDIEFVRRWVDRNVPPCEEGPAVITVDAGQFMFEGRKLTGMVDLELVCVGDRHVDMAALRTRDRIEEIGDLESFYDLYHQRGGIRLDRDRIAFHWVTFAMLTPLQIAHQLAHPEGETKYHEYIGWYARAMDDALKDVARLCDVELEDYRLPEPRPDRSGHLLEACVAVVEAMPAADDYDAYRRFDLGLAARYLGDYARRRTAMEREYCDEVEAITGKRPLDAWEGDEQMVEFIATAGPEFDKPILQLLHRRNQRVNQILRMHYLRRRTGKEAE